MKKGLVFTALFILPFLIAAGSVYLIYNEVTSDPIYMGHTGQETLHYVVEGVEKETLTENDIRTIYNSNFNTDYDDIVFHRFPSDSLFQQPRIYYLPLYLDLKASVAGELVMEFDVPSDMTVQVGHTKVSSGDIVHTFSSAGTEQVDLFFYFEGEELEFRDGQFTIEFSFRLNE